MTAEIKVPFSWKDIGLGMILGLSLIANLYLYNRVVMNEQDSEIDCDITFAQFYYHPDCGWCERQIDEGGLEQLEEYGVTIQRVDVSKASYDFIEGTPAWEIDGTLTYGYKTLDQLEEMFGC